MPRRLLLVLFALEASANFSFFLFDVTEEPKSITIAADSSVRIFTVRKPEDAFFVFSCHCRTSNLLMHPLEDIIGSDFVNSTDPAMVVFNDSMTSPPEVFVRNPNSYNVTVLASARGYTETDPVPGWCTTRDGIRPKPFLSIAWDSAVIKVNFSRASLLPHEDLDANCNEKHMFQYEIYHKYLQEGTNPVDLDKDFVSEIKKFSDIDDIRMFGTKVDPLSENVDRQVFSSYRPIGSLYAVIVHYQNTNNSGTSLYGVSHTYGCHIDRTGLCPDPSHVVTKIVCGLAVFVGIVLAFGGHRLFIMSHFIFGFYAGCFIGYILLTINFSLSFTMSFTLTAVCGLLGAVLASLLWLVLGIPVLSVFLPTLELGVLAASILMFLPSLNVPSLTNDLYYWLVFLCIVLAIPGVLLAFTQKASILSCVIIGTYTTIVPIDFFLGTNLRYIMLNVLRRATVPEFFRAAIILPPVQTSDVALLACWLGLALLALVTQLLLERRKAPFPPSALHVMRWRRELGRGEGSDSETDPLFENDVNQTGTEAVAAPVVGYILGYSSVATGLPVQQSHNHQVQQSHNHQLGRDSPDLRESRRPRPSAPQARHRDIFKPPSPDPSLPAYSPRMVGGEV